MPPAGSDPFPREIEVIRARRRSVELRLEQGRLLARVPLRLPGAELDELLPQLREQLWSALARKRVFDQAALEACARRVARARLADLPLPPHRVRFSSRQQRRWGSCTLDPAVPEGRIRISDRLRGHPVWILEHLLLHELIHLVIPDHGGRFQSLMARCPHGERAEGYLEALEGMTLLGEELPGPKELLRRVALRVERRLPGSGGAALPDPVHGAEDLPLFAPAAGSDA